MVRAAGSGNLSACRPSRRHGRRSVWTIEKTSLTRSHSAGGVKRYAEGTMLDAAKSAIKRLLYAGGAFYLYHRLRNRSALTVAMFHRVLSPKDPRWNGALPHWTLA